MKLKKKLMKRNCLLLSLAVIFLTSAGIKAEYEYESVKGDPFQARIYTLGNGLKVYLSVNKDRPRVFTQIGVRAGSKNDPAETTGLAHYFEHLMFKGTQNFGTSDYVAEKPLLDKIESLFETYRKTTDEAKRKEIYAEIDRLSQEASKIAIPNEYEKLMSVIGGQGSNAFTSYDYTGFTVDIPSNEIESWAIIQSERFKNPVIRGFHTELEAVYEEYNSSLASDDRKITDAIMNGLFPHHPYGKQTTLGKPEHLKNPSITNIKAFFETYYVPNNMVIAMAGDFDPDVVIRIIDKYFSFMKPKEVPKLKIEPEQPITAPVVKEIVGQNAESVSITYRIPGANTKEGMMLPFICYMIYNGRVGLIDKNITQKQRVLRAGCGYNMMTDYGHFIAQGTPKEGQTLEEVRDLLFEQIDLIKKGQYEDWLPEASINNLKLNRYNRALENQYVANAMLYSFLDNIEWKDQVNQMDFLSKLTKKDIVDYCNKYLNDNYLIVYKRKGESEAQKIEKPQITPISLNQDKESDFLVKIKEREVKPFEPVFLDYSKDLTITKVKKDIPLLYIQNTVTPIFRMSFIYEIGNNHDKALGTAFNYLNYLGTSSKTAEEIQAELFNLACTMSMSASNDRVTITIGGLSDNFEKALKILEERLTNSKADQVILDSRIKDILKQRADAKSNQSANFSRLTDYAFWGANSPGKNFLSESELDALKPDDLINKVKNLKNYEHTITYYGPLTVQTITDVINQNHSVAETLQPIPEPVKFIEQETNENRVLLVHYNTKQINMTMIHKGGAFDKNLEPYHRMYNYYFDGGGMGGIVFQEMRESRGLAYSANAYYQSPANQEQSYHISANIATQSDKMAEAIEAFNHIINDMPEAENAFSIAKERVITGFRTGRTLRDGILNSYINAKRFGHTVDPNIESYNKILKMTLKDVKEFQEKYIKNKTYTYCILGDTKELDMEALKKIGPVTILTQEEIFGY